MTRLAMISDSHASPRQRAQFEAVQATLGAVPNFVRVFAQSPDALDAFLGLYHIAGAGSLDPATRERIALALAQHSGCEYCLSAHAALGEGAGLDAREISANRAGRSTDRKAAVAVAFALAVAEHKGDVTTAELQAMRAAGYSEGDIVEVITHVALNLLTNMLGRTSQVEIDFPRVPLQAAA
jgi:uncharacterized peroxidase-related enzyme